MKINHQVLTTGTTILLFLVASHPAYSTPQTYHINVDICNTTGSIANDFHIRLSSPNNPLDLTAVRSYPIGTVFPVITVTGDPTPGIWNGSTYGPATLGDGTSPVTINFSGANVTPNVSCNPSNIPATPSSGFHPLVNFVGDNVSIDQFNWSFAGIPVNPILPAPTVYSYGSLNPNNPSFFATAVQVFQNLNDQTPVAVFYTSGEGGDRQVIGNFTTQPGFFSFATIATPSLLPAEDLNFNLLPLFPAFSPRFALAPGQQSPEFSVSVSVPESSNLFGLGVLVGLGFLSTKRKKPHSKTDSSTN